MYGQWAEKHKKFVKKAEAVQKALSALQREADKIGESEKITVTLFSANGRTDYG